MILSFPMSTMFSIKVYKQYFNFASSHFMIFQDGSREPLHGHNYKVSVKGNALSLENDMVFDFLDIKPVVRMVCDSLDHKLLIPIYNPHLKIVEEDQNLKLTTSKNHFFSIPKEDVLLLPIENTSAERLAIYIANEIKIKILEKFQYSFSELEIEVEETPGQSAVYILKS